MKLDIVNFRGEAFPLSSNRFFYLIDMDGQSAVNTSISSVTIGSNDGDEVNNIQAQPRSVTIYLRIKSGVNVEEAKRAILRVVKLKTKATLVWTQNEKTVAINGFVESVEMPRYNNTVTMEITLHCAQPFWEDVENVIQQIKEVIDLHYFTDEADNMLFFPEEGIAFGEYDFRRTRQVYNAGDVSVGMEIEIVAYKTVTNPIIYDTDGNFFGIGYGEGNKKVVMQNGDVIRIKTVKGEKSVALNGVSMFDKVKPQSKWLQLSAGDNEFSINSDDEDIDNMTFSIAYKQRYI